MTARLSLVFSYDKDKQIFYYSLLCIYTICSKSVPSSQHRCTTSQPPWITLYVLVIAINVCKDGRKCEKEN